MNARRALTIAATAALLLVSVPEAASSGTWWEGQFNPNVRLDTAQVATESTVVRDLAPALIDTDKDCWDDTSCLRTAYGLDPEYVSVDDLPEPITDADGVTHTGCFVAVGDTSLMFCEDGYAETS